MFGLLWLISPLFVREPGVMIPTLLASFAALGLIYGLILAVTVFVRRETWDVWPSPIVVLVVWLAALALGTLILLAPSVLADWIFPPMYVLGVALPVVAILSFAVRRTSVTGFRTTLQVVYGGVVATLLAFVIELMLVVVVIIVGFLIASVSPNWLGLDSLAPALQSNDPGVLSGILRNPIILALAFLGLGVAGPIIEEAAKAGSMIFWSHWEPTRNRALVWGLASGLGFALTEGMLNSILSVGLDATGVVLFVRAGASLMHGMTTAIVGLGWWRTYTTRRPWPIIGAFILAVAIHGFWNIAVLGRVALGPAPAVASPESGPALAVITSDLLAAASVALVGAMAFILAHLTRRPQWATSGSGSAADMG
ncbi:MAG: PrsW family glutamic-type intramembrane protease [Anaerolineae bacterium]